VVVKAETVLRKAGRDMAYNSTNLGTHHQNAGKFSAPPGMFGFSILEVQGKMLSQSSLTSASTTGASRVREQAQHLIEFCVIHQRIMIVTKQSMKRSTKTARQHNFHSLLTYSRNKGVRPMLLEL
jgi:hypothetical protein